MSGRPDVGTIKGAPAEKHAKLGVWVFSMGITSEFAGFSNKGDWVLLSDPKGRAVHVVSWGTFKEELPTGDELITERAEEGGQGSLCRYMLGGPMIGHSALDGRLMSPGKHPIESIYAEDDSGR